MVITCRFYKQKYPEVNETYNGYLKVLPIMLLTLVIGRGCRDGECALDC